MYKTNIILKAYGGSKLSTLFKIKTLVEINNHKTYIEFIIVKENAQPTLGLQGCLDLKLLKRIDNRDKNVYIVSVNNTYLNSESFIKNNKALFEEKGTFPDMYTIKIDKNKNGVIRPPRRLPKTLMLKFKAELDKLLKNKIITKVNEPKQWASNIILVEKPDKYKVMPRPYRS